MKKIVVLLSLLLTFTFCGCGSPVAQDNQIAIPDTPPIDDTFTENEPDLDEDEQEKKKKTYTISTANGLRVRSAPNSSSRTLGYLDENDVVTVTSKQGAYYQTTFREQTAYVHSSYCKEMQIEAHDDKIERAIDVGSALLGHPYVWGSQRYHWGNGVLNKNFVKGEFDCSALVQYVYYKSNRVLLDVTSRSQVNNGLYVAKSDLRRGDLMFFTNASRKNKTGNERIGHVGIYFGNNYILHTASDHAVIEPISSLRWSYYITARRVV